MTSGGRSLLFTLLCTNSLTSAAPPPNNQIPHPFSYPEPKTNEVYEVIEITEDGPSSQVDNEP